MVYRAQVEGYKVENLGGRFKYVGRDEHMLHHNS